MEEGNGFILLSGVVRNRKTMASTRTTERARSRTISVDAKRMEDTSCMSRLLSYLNCHVIVRNIRMRVHKFAVRWDITFYLLSCLVTLLPFCFTGQRIFAIFPLLVWAIYNAVFLMGPKATFKFLRRIFSIEFTSTMEEFFSPRVMPVLSLSFFLVVMSLMVTGHKLQGPPLCFNTCRVCLTRWESAIYMSEEEMKLAAEGTPPPGLACDHSNGRELLTYYTMSQTSFVLFFTVIITMVLCMAWRVASEESRDRLLAEDWLKGEDQDAYKLRQEINHRHGPPGSSIRAEGSPSWVAFGVASAIIFTLLGCRNWRAMPPSNTTTLLVVLNVLTITASTLLLHLAFFGRLIAIYKRNHQRVQMLSELLRMGGIAAVDAWWNCRNFVLNEDLALDYDIGGLAVSAMFLINLSVFCVLISQTWEEGFPAILEPPGNYCAFGVLYLTLCLFKIFTLATTTFEEQLTHVNILQKMSFRLASLPSSSSGANLTLMPGQTVPMQKLGLGHGTTNGLYLDICDDTDFDVGLSMDTPEGRPMRLGALEPGDGGMSPTSMESGGTTSAATSGSLRSSTSVLPMPSAPVQAPSAPSSSSMSVTASGTNLVSDNGSDMEGEGPGVGGVAAVEVVSNDVQSSMESSSAPLPKGTEAVVSRSGSREDDYDVAGDRLSFAEKGGLLDETEDGGEEMGIAPRDGVGSVGGLLNTIFRPLTGLSIKTPLDEDPEKIPLMGGSSHERDGHMPTAEPNPASPRVAMGALCEGPSLQRTPSLTVESRRQTLAEMTSQITKYDPYPCILGIPVMPGLFKTAKFYIYILFTLVTTKVCFVLYESYDSVLDIPAVEVLGVAD